MISRRLILRSAINLTLVVIILALIGAILLPVYVDRHPASKIGDVPMVLPKAQ